jgi:hypothetical protein
MSSTPTTPRAKGKTVVRPNTIINREAQGYLGWPISRMDARDIEYTPTGLCYLGNVQVSYSPASGDLRLMVYE